MLLILCMLAAGTSLSLARNVNIILHDGTLLKGDMIGANDQVVYLQGDDHKARQLKWSEVNDIFDAATGEKISAAGPQPLIPVATPPASTGPGSAQTATTLKQSFLYIYGTMQSGLTGHMPCEPWDSSSYIPGNPYFNNGMEPYDSSWGAGMSMEWRMADFLSFNLDAGFSSWDKLLAKKDGYGIGFWVWEQSGYNDARIGPFPMDVRYYMDTTILRLGTKYYPMTGLFQPWVGVSAGLYAWQVTIGNREEEKKYSDTSGTAFSTSLQVGIDLVMDDFVIRFFGDFATAVANPRLENLFQQGWTYEDPTGEFVEGPYRYGIAIGMSI